MLGLLRLEVTFRRMVAMSRLLLIVFFLSAVSTEAAEVVDSIVAVVNGRKITRSEIEKEAQPGVDTLLSKYRGEVPLSEAKGLLNQVLTSKIEEILLMDEAEAVLGEEQKRKISRAVDSEMERLVREAGSRTALQEKLSEEGISLDEKRRRLETERRIQALLDSKIRKWIIISPREVRRYYDDHVEDYHVPERVNFRQIVVKFSEYLNDEEALASAQRLRKKLLAGADFAMLARKRSRGPNASEGGLWKDVGRGMLLPEVEEVVFSISLGEISPIVRTPLGYHIIRVESREAERQIPFEEVQESIRRKLTEEIFKERLQKYLNELRSRSEIVILLKSPSAVPTGVNP